eukprot:3695201-Rhodomonas_salina.1
MWTEEVNQTDRACEEKGEDVTNLISLDNKEIHHQSCGRQRKKSQHDRGMSRTLLSNGPNPVSRRWLWPAAGSNPPSQSTPGEGGGGGRGEERKKNNRREEKREARENQGGAVASSPLTPRFVAVAIAFSVWVQGSLGSNR